MPLRYLLIAVDGDDRAIVCHYDNKQEADDAMVQEQFWIDQLEYGVEYENIVLHVEEIELPEIGDKDGEAED